MPKGIYKHKSCSEETKRKLSLSHKGKVFSEEHKRKMSLVRKGKTYEERLGKEKAIKVRKKQSDAHKGEKNHFFGKHLSKEHRKKLKLTRAKQILPIKDTSIEIKIQNFLKLFGIEFFTHQYIKDIEHGYQCDILIPSTKTIIECDGDYWHNYPYGTEIDLQRNKELREKRYRIIRLWENEINTMELNDLQNLLKESENE